MASTDAWADLINGLGILHSGKTSDISPTHCAHDTLTIMSDPARFTPEELEHLERLGFHAKLEEQCFYSFRFGSA